MVALADMHPIAILTRYTGLKKPLVYQAKMLGVLAIIKRYGGHTTDCIISVWMRCPSPGDNLKNAECSCGWDEILEELK